MTTTRQLAQQAQERFLALVLDIMADWCANTYGVNNGVTSFCTATGAVGTECYNTYGSCQAKAAYVKTSKTFSFCSRGTKIPAGETLRPYIIDYAFTPTELKIGGGLAARSNIEFTLADEVCSDFQADPYAATRPSPAGGTFMTRWLARNYNIAGRFAKSRNGYVTDPFDWTVFQDELYVIESIAGPDSNGNYTVTCSDVVRPLDKNMLPVPTTGTLVSDCLAYAYRNYAAGADATHITFGSDASAVDGFYDGMECYISANTSAGERRTLSGYVGATRTATVAAWTVIPDTTSLVEVSALNVNVGLGNGVQYPDPAVTGQQEFVCIGDEVIRYDAIAGDVLSWADSTYRAQFGTTRADHKAGDGVQHCFTLIAQSASASVQKLMNGASIADTYIDLVGLLAEDTDWLGTNTLLTVCIPKPEQASSLLDDLLIDLRMHSWWDPVVQKQKFKVDAPELASNIKTISPDETIQGSMQIEPQDALRITQSYLSFAPFSATANMTNRQSFKITYGSEEANAESPNEYNGVIQKQTYSRWLSDANQLYAASFVSREISRFRDAPWKAALQLDPRDEVQMGDLINVSTRKKTDMKGTQLVTRMRVTKILKHGNFDIEALSTNFAKRYAFIAPAGFPDYSLASAAQRDYAFIGNSSGLMSDGTACYAII